MCVVVIVVKTRGRCAISSRELSVCAIFYVLIGNRYSVLNTRLAAKFEQVPSTSVWAFLPDLALGCLKIDCASSTLTLLCIVLRLDQKQQ